MFKIAIKDSLGFAKNHIIIFSFLVLALILISYINFGFEFKELGPKDFLNFQGIGIALYFIIIAITLGIFYSAFYIHKSFKKITLTTLWKEYKVRVPSIFLFTFWLIAMLIVIASIMRFLDFIDLVREIKMFEMYQYLIMDRSIVVLFIIIYAFFYIVLKIYFGGIFAFLDKDLLVVFSLSKAFKLLRYNDIFKISVSFSSFMFVISCVALFIVRIMELFMSKQSIEFFKFGQFNFYGFIYLFVWNAVILLSISFITSYGWQLHNKVASK